MVRKIYFLVMLVVGLWSCDHDSGPATFGDKSFKIFSWEKVNLITGWFQLIYHGKLVKINNHK